MTVTLGAHNIKAKEKTQQIIPVANATPHPAYNPDKRSNDIMLLKVRPAILTPHTSTHPSVLTTHPSPGDCALLGAGLLPALLLSSYFFPPSTLSFNVTQSASLLVELLSSVSCLSAGEKCQED